MQLGTKYLEHYSLHATFRHDALWQFKPKNFQLFAKITDFYFEEPTELAEEAYPIAIGDQTFSSTDSEKRVEFTTQLPESFKLNFMQSFKPFSEQNICIDPSFFDGRRQLQFLKGKVLNFERKTNTQFHCFNDTDYKIQEEFKFPEQDEVTEDKMRVKGYCNVIKDLEIPFLARVQVTARADCADTTNGEKVENVEIQDVQVIEYLLKFEKFTGKIRKQIEKKNHTIGRGGKSSTGQKPSKDEAIPEGVVNCDVSGRLKCSCGLDTYLDFKMIS